MTIKEMIEKLEAIEKEIGNVKVVNAYNQHSNEEDIKIHFHKAGDTYFGGKYEYFNTEVEIF